MTLKHRIFDHLFSLTLGAALIVWIFWELITSSIPLSQAVWADDFDSALLRWFYEWGYIALWEKKSLHDFWNAPMFFPNRFSFAYTDTLLSAQLTYTPLRLLGLDAMTSVYGTLMAWTGISVYLADRYLVRLGESQFLNRALIIFCSIGISSTTAFLIHYQLFGLLLFPAFFLALWVGIRDRSDRDIWIAAMIWLVSGAYPVYAIPMFVVAAIPLFILPKQHLFWVMRFFIRPWGIAFLALFAIYIGVHLYPYLMLKAQFGKASFMEAAKCSAHLGSLWTDKSSFSVLYGKWFRHEWCSWERALFPGLLLATVFTGSILGGIWIRYRNRKLWDALGPRFAMAWATGLLVWIMSIGPYLFENRWLVTPHWVLSQLVPGLRDIRSPGRFGMFLGLPMGLLLVAILAYFKRRFTVVPSKVWSALVIVLLGVVVLENRMKFPVSADWIEPKIGIYEDLKESGLVAPGTGVIDLPATDGDWYNSLRRTIFRLHGTLRHHGRLPVGYGAKYGAEHSEMFHLDGSIFKDEKKGRDPAVFFEFAEKIGAQTILVHPQEYEPGLAELFPKAAWVRDGRWTYQSLAEGRLMVFSRQK